MPFIGIFFYEDPLKLTLYMYNEIRRVIHMNIDLIKEARIMDEREIYCRIQISYSELGKMLRIASGMTATAGVDGVVGINENTLVCYELTMFGGKPAREVFRLPFESILSIELRKGLLGLSYILFVQNEKRRYKLVATLGKKQQLEKLYQTIKNEKK